LWIAVFLAALLITQSGPVVGVAVDNPFPNLGDTVQITVGVCQAPPNWNDSLWLSIDSPDGHTLYYEQLASGNLTGIADLTVSLPYTVAQDASPGLYTVTVTWDHQYVQTGFTVETQPIPEFPFPLAVLLFAFTVATLAISRRKAGSSAKTSSAHSGTRGIH
jgi:hypothetical protein